MVGTDLAVLAKIAGGRLLGDSVSVQRCNVLNTDSTQEVAPDYPRCR